MLFSELAFIDRFAACRLAGFKYVEFPFPYAFDPTVLKDQMHKAGLELVLFDLPVDDWDSGGRGCATDPNAVETFRKGLETAINYAEILHPKYLTCLVGKKLTNISYSEQWNILVNNLQYVCDRLSSLGIDLLVETFNIYDHPDFYLTRVTDAIALVGDVNRKNFKIQIDVYHMQIMEGNLTATIRQHIDHIGHIQIGDVPDRHQPGTGEINFDFLLREIDLLGYQRYIGLEYVPLGDTKVALSWLNKYNLMPD